MRIGAFSQVTLDARRSRGMTRGPLFAGQKRCCSQTVLIRHPSAVVGVLAVPRVVLIFLQNTFALTWYRLTS
jgi:hypothetical protein